MNPNSAIRSWLRRKPHPVKVMLDGSPKNVIVVPEGGDKWRDLIQTLRIAGPETITLLDADGGVLRARKWDYEDEEGETPAEAPTTTEKDFPIAALATEMRLMTEKAMDALVKALENADARAQAFNDAQIEAIKAQARAEAEAAIALAKAEAAQKDDDTGDLLRTVATGMGLGKQGGPPNGA